MAMGQRAPEKDVSPYSRDGELGTAIATFESGGGPARRRQPLGRDVADPCRDQLSKLGLRQGFGVGRALVRLGRENLTLDVIQEPFLRALLEKGGEGQDKRLDEETLHPELPILESAAHAALVLREF